MKRKIIIKVDSVSATEVLKNLSIENADLEIEMEDTGATYKKLSSLPGILDWEFKDENEDKEVGSIKESIESARDYTDDASILFEALFALKLSHPSRSFESLCKEDLEEQIQFVSQQNTTFNHVTIKALIEQEYSNAEVAKKSIMEIFKKEWDTILSYGTLLGFMVHVYKKNKEQ